MNAEEIVARFPGDDYVGFHSRRYALVLELLREYAPHATAILDVGPSTLTALVAEQYGSTTRVDSVGFEDIGANRTGGTHFEFDLNRLPDAMSEPTNLGRYDAVLCCEVLEHLLVAPEHLLAWLRAHLSEHGVLVVQTPNAAALDRRMKLLAGRQPYDALDPDRSGARHVRECTYAELREFASAAGPRRRARQPPRLLRLPLLARSRWHGAPAAALGAERARSGVAPGPALGHHAGVPAPRQGVGSPLS